MATRLAVQASKEELYSSLKSSCLNGVLAPGTMLPTVRDLGEQYGISANVVFQVIQRLTDEGFLYTVPRVGAFVGQPRREKVEPYLMVVPPHESSGEHYLVQAQLGFEDRIAQLGEHSVILTPQEARLHLERSALPRLSGAFENIENWMHSARLFDGKTEPVALFGWLDEVSDAAASGGDYIAFDDIGGSVQATNHLWQNGHRNIGFIALHCPDNIGVFSWSLRREAGWAKAIEQLGGRVEEMVFRPRQTSGPHYDEQVQAGYEAAQGLLGRSDVTAVVVTNAIAGEGVFRAFQDANLPAEKWPAMVCFDAAPGIGRSIMSYMRLPWEEIGREAAQVLWERRTGRLTGPPVQKLVPMRLIPRLSCRADWATSTALAQNHFATSELTAPQVVAAR